MQDSAEDNRGDEQHTHDVSDPRQDRLDVFAEDGRAKAADEEYGGDPAGVEKDLQYRVHDTSRVRYGAEYGNEIIVCVLVYL